MEPEEHMPRQTAAAVKWVYTKWEDKDLFPLAMCKYRVEGIEIAPETGKQHWQCFCILENKQVLENSRHDIFADPARGSPKSANETSPLVVPLFTLRKPRPSLGRQV